MNFKDQWKRVREGWEFERRSGTFGKIFGRRAEDRIPHEEEEEALPGLHETLAKMAAAGNRTAEMDGASEHELASEAQVGDSVVGASGRMDQHRKPIVSINGQDVEWHEKHSDAA